MKYSKSISKEMSTTVPFFLICSDRRGFYFVCAWPVYSSIRRLKMKFQAYYQSWISEISIHIEFNNPHFSMFQAAAMRR